MATIKQILTRCQKAKCPEDVFAGALNDKDGEEAKRQFRELSLVVHPDKAPGNKEAEEAFKLLNNWYEQALEKVAKGIYGDKSKTGKPFVIHANKKTYTVTGSLASGDIAELYYATSSKNEKVVLKIPRDAKNNDLINNERIKLAKIKAKKLGNHISAPLDILTLPDKRNVNIFPVYKGTCHTLAEVIEARPKGIDQRDACWMFNRLMSALIYSSEAGVIHGAVLPCHVIISCENHWGGLIDWCYALDEKEKPKAIVPAYKTWYPKEYFDKKPITVSTDVYMAAMTMIKLLGGNPVAKTFPATVHHNIAGFLRACTLGQAKRIQRPLEVFTEFNDLINSLWAKKFRPFSLT